MSPEPAGPSAVTWGPRPKTPPDDRPFLSGLGRSAGSAADRHVLPILESMAGPRDDGRPPGPVGEPADEPVRPNRYYLAHVDDDGDYRDLYLLAGRLGSRGGYRLTGDGWEPDDLPVEWMIGGADHLDPIPVDWARRRAADLGVDDRTFDWPTRFLR